MSAQPGTLYGLLVVVGEAEPRRKPSGRNVRRVTVLCACGVERVVDVDNLRTGNTTSCGCSRRAPRPARRAEHVTYGGWHERLGRDRGPATAHACVGCGQFAAEWSLDEHQADDLVEDRDGWPLRYALDAERYSARCITCHRQHDADARPPATTCRRGHDAADRYGDGSCRPCRREKYATTHHHPGSAVPCTAPSSASPSS